MEIGKWDHTSDLKNLAVTLFDYRCRNNDLSSELVPTLFILYSLLPSALGLTLFPQAKLP